MFPLEQLNETLNIVNFLLYGGIANGGDLVILNLFILNNHSIYPIILLIFNIFFWFILTEDVSESENSYQN